MLLGHRLGIKLIYNWFEIQVLIFLVCDWETITINLFPFKFYSTNSHTFAKEICAAKIKYWVTTKLWRLVWSGRVMEGALLQPSEISRIQFPFNLFEQISRFFYILQCISIFIKFLLRIEKYSRFRQACAILSIFITQITIWALKEWILI